ncbi:MAG: phosphatase PAP2 family protein [Clostridium sp.]|uniref:phosphatase PAP2 family protein n=1 Tax=Clostridium sp. TaxID=1506 RepID=UPI0029067B64|nr:phosphatase PAP2 family protein [Clostridium sp.]MDU4939810.1 phosphatase PAP2 family protein [Clostridium sp.]
MNYIYNMDITILDWIQSVFKCAFLDWFMPIVTSLGNAGIVWIIICVLLLTYKKTRKYGVMMGCALILCLLIGNLFLKPVVARVRPFDINTAIDILIKKPLDFSFPSGHTMSSFAAATVLIYMDKKIGVISLILATIIGFSRLYLYVHYPSDVIVGLFMGVLLGIISIKLCSIIKYQKNNV